MTELERLRHNESSRKYMLRKRADERKKKRCLDCGSDRVEYRCRLCSECAQVRIDISNDISKHNKAKRDKQDDKN